MRKLVLLLVSIALAVVLLSAAYYGGAPVAAQTTAAKPNFVFILADDMRYDDFSYMPKTRNLIGSQGTTFSKAYVPLSTCCPSRVSILTGMYTHNHNVWFNDNGARCGWEGLGRRPRSTVARCDRSSEVR